MAIAALLVRLHAGGPTPYALGELIEQARGLPAEFAADALIRVSASPALTPALQRDLLDEAFMRAYATPDVSRRSSMTSLQPESRQSARQFAYDSGLTRLTLQARAAQRLAVVDKAHARELFEWIDVNFAPATCEDPLVPAVDEYYSTLSLLARTTFGGDRGEAIRFLERHLFESIRIRERRRAGLEDGCLQIDERPREILLLGDPQSRNHRLAGIDRNVADCRWNIVI